MRQFIVTLIFILAISYLQRHPYHKTPDTIHSALDVTKGWHPLLSVQNANIYTGRNFGREEMGALVGALFHGGCCSALNLPGLLLGDSELHVKAW